MNNLPTGLHQRHLDLSLEKKGGGGGSRPESEQKNSVSTRAAHIQRWGRAPGAVGNAELPYISMTYVMTLHNDDYTQLVWWEFPNRFGKNKECESTLYIHFFTLNFSSLL